MKKLLALFGMTAGGWLGWELGGLVSIFTAFMVSIVGTGLGLFLVNRFNQRYLP